MQLDFAAQSYGRSGGGLPAARLVNMFPEVAPAGPNRSARLPRPGLQLLANVGNSGIRGLYQQDGAFNGDVFGVVGTTLFRGVDPIGDVGLTAIARFAASYSQLVVVSGGAAWCYDGDTLEQIDIPDGQMVSDVFVLGSRFYFVIAGSDVWYFSALDDATSIDSLAFATADSAPDASIGAAVRGDRAIFFGRTTVEFWRQTGDPDAPLVREPGSTYTKGCASQASIVYADNRVFWVGNDLKVYTIGAPNRVSDHALEEKLRLCTTPSLISALSFSWDGHDFVIVNIPGQGSWALHVESGEWLQWTSHGKTTFRCTSAIMVGTTPYLGDADTGNVYVLADVATDNGDPIEFIASAIAPVGVINTLRLDCSTGVGLEDGTDPIVEMRYSLDLGRTWSSWRAKSLGVVGDYTHRVLWARLGNSRKPRPIEFRTTSPVKAVYTGVRINE